jgi:Predicted membrane-associated Zn-dependent proteases 1
LITPEYNQELKKYTIGISPKFEVKTIQYPLDQAIVKAFDKTKELTVSIYNVVAGLFTGEVSFKTLGGPISIAKFSGEALETGITTFLFAMAFMSLQLGYLNLLPIPVLDGGLIFILLIESIIRRPLPEKAKEYLAYIGFALLGSLMIYVIFNDILRAIQ